MRKIKIVNDGFLEGERGHIIECPKKFKQCHNTCAWFSIVTYPVCVTTEEILPKCKCRYTTIGELTT